MDDLEGEISDEATRLEFGVLKSSFTMIAPSFENISTLEVLDLSHTSIQSLPLSIFKLSQLLNLTLQECSMLMELPPEIGELKNLMTLDLEGTEIMYLPKELGNSEKLECLRVSFCAYADEYKDCHGIENIIPRTIISKFSKLKELSICVHPDAKWWEVEVIEAVVEKLQFLPHLQTLKLYLPTANELQCFLLLENCHAPIYSTLSDFSLKVGHSEQLTSYLKTKLVDSFEKLEKCLKYENGEGSTDDIKGLIRHAKALFLSRHWTIEKLSIFDISTLNYCLLTECNEMHTIVDADDSYGDKSITHNGKDAFEFLKYLAIHSMKKLQSIWKGPIAGNSFSCLQVLALHTCPDLTTVFTEGMLDKLHNLTVVIVEDCPKVNSLVSQQSSHGFFRSFLPNLRKIMLLDLPELVSLSSGVYIAPRLDTLLVFNCLKLDYLSPNELSKDVKEIKGEIEWWDALKNRDEHSRAFVPLKRDGILMNQLAEDTNSLREFHKLQSHGGASTKSSSSFFPSDSQPLPAHFLSYEAKKHLDWGMFMQYLKYRKPPVPLVQCNSGHVIEFLKYLNKFGDVRVHVQSCVLFGHPNPDVTCFCPLSEAWGTLEAIATRLHVVSKENMLLDMKPFASQDVRSYLNNVRESQENALGIPPKKHGFPVPTAGDESYFGRRYEKSILLPRSREFFPVPFKKAGDFREGTINSGILRSPSIVGEIYKPSQVLSSDIRRMKSGPGSKSAGTRTEASTEPQYPILDTSDSEYLMPFMMDAFRTTLQVKVKSTDHSLSVDHGSTTFPWTKTQGSSSIHEVKEDDYVISNTMSPEVSSRLRYIAAWASSNGCIQPFVETYIREQKAVMQIRFLRFNIEEWSTYEVKRLEWGLLESLIDVWIRSVKTSLEQLFASEKHLCEEIFHGLGIDIYDICFEVIIQDYQIQVFNIIYTLRFINPPPDKLDLILDLYETLDHFLNGLCYIAKPRDLFQATVHTQLLTMLSDKIISSLSIFEMVLLYHESSVIFVGPIDPLPRYVMSYLYQLCDHKHALRRLSLPKLPSLDDDDDDDDDDLSTYSEELKGQSEPSRHVIWIIMMMVSHLEVKAKLCEDGSASHFFAMKNISYIVHNIERHKELRELVGYDYFGKLVQKLDYAKVNYLMLELEKIIKIRDYGVE